MKLQWFLFLVMCALPQLADTLRANDCQRVSDALLSPPYGVFEQESFGRFLLSGQYLFMKMQQEGISYGTGSTVNPDIALFQETFFTFPFDFSSGFRALAGWEEPCKSWAIKASFDHLPSSAKGVHAATYTGYPPTLSGEQIFPTFGNTGNTPKASNGGKTCLEAHWKGYFDQLDLFLDGNFDYFNCLGIHLILGLRSAYIQQSIHSITLFEGTSGEPQSLIHQKGTQNHYLKTRLYGLGPLTALEMQWNLYKGLSFYGFIEGALLYTKCTFSLHGLEVQLLNDQQFVFEQIQKNDYQRAKPALDLGLGFKYCLPMGREGTQLLIHTGWEHHIWFNQNFFQTGLLNLQNPNQTSHPCTGDLSLIGWVLGLDFIF